MILMWSTPWRSCSRAAWRTSSTPSAMPSVNAIALQQWQVAPVSVRRRESLCPPVWPMGRPATKSRGPGRRPWATPSRMPQSAPPVSRTVVKPRSSMACMRAAPRAVIRVSGIASSARMLTSDRKTWTWQSISPGIRVRPPASSVRLAETWIGRADTSRIRSPSTTTEAFSVRLPEAGSSRLALLIRIIAARRILQPPAGLETGTAKPTGRSRHLTVEEGAMDLERAVRAAAGGDLDAFAELTRRFQHMAFGYALSFVRDFGQAEDVVQEAFVAAWYALPTLADPAAFAGWLRGIVRHRAHRVRRRKHFECVPLTDADTVAAGAPTADRRVERRQEVGNVLAAIAELPRALREVVALYYVHDCSHQDIATFLGVPVTTVNNRLHAARAQLKRRTLTMVKDALEAHQLPDDFAARIGRIV